MKASRYIRQKTAVSVLSLLVLFSQAFASLLIPAHAVVHAHADASHAPHASSSLDQSIETRAPPVASLLDEHHVWDALFNHDVGDACDDWNSIAPETALVNALPSVSVLSATPFFAVTSSYSLPPARYPVTALPRAPPQS